MGVDIYAYKNIQKVESDTEDSFYLGNANGFIHFTLDEGYYTGKIMSKTSCTYSTFNTCRDLICKHVYNTRIAREYWLNVLDDPKKPFYHLFNHGDNEGDFSNEFCKIIYNDFVNHMDKIMNIDSDLHLGIIIEMFQVFEDAAKNNGIVHFT